VDSVRSSIAGFALFAICSSYSRRAARAGFWAALRIRPAQSFRATVTIRDVDRGTTRTLVTDEAGLYNAPNLLPGTYTIRVELSGFASAERPNIKLEVGQDIRVDISLRGGPDFTDPSAAAGTSFGFRPQTPDVTSSNPVLGSGGDRAIQLGLKIIF